MNTLILAILLCAFVSFGGVDSQTKPSAKPTYRPSLKPSWKPSPKPTREPSFQPTSRPTSRPTARPTSRPTSKPSRLTLAPTLIGMTNPPTAYTGPPATAPTFAPSTVDGSSTKAAAPALDGGAIAGIVIAGLVIILGGILIYRYVRAKKLRAMGVQKYDAGDAELQGNDTLNPIQQQDAAEIDPYLAQNGGGYGQNKY